MEKTNTDIMDTVEDIAAKAGSNLTMRRCEIVSNLADREGNTLFDMDNLQQVLEDRACIKNYAYIIHDKDTYTEEEEKQNPEHKNGTLKTPHIHLLLRFTSPQHLKNIAQWFGIGENFVSRIHGNFESAVRYLTHHNAPDKYRYDVEEVTANFDVKSILEKADERQLLDMTIDKILSGEIREYNKTLEIDHKLLVRYNRSIEEAFKVRAEHLQATIHDRETACIFITGASGAGKTTLAKEIAREQNMSFYVSSSGNDLLDGYKQQDCIILDDLRPSTLGLSDLLKLLDNNTVSSVRSRYRNKLIFSKLIILTSTLDIDEFYRNVFKDENESVIQLKRRCGTYIRMTKERIYISIWDNKKRRYSNEVEYMNTVSEKYIPKTNKTTEDVTEQVSKWIPFIRKAGEDERQDGFESTADLSETEQEENPFTQGELPFSSN